MMTKKTATQIWRELAKDVREYNKQWNSRNKVFVQAAEEILENYSPEKLLDKYQLNLLSDLVSYSRIKTPPALLAQTNDNEDFRIALTHMMYDNDPGYFYVTVNKAIDELDVLQKSDSDNGLWDQRKRFLTEYKDFAVTKQGQGHEKSPYEYSWNHNTSDMSFYLERYQDHIGTGTDQDRAMYAVIEWEEIKAQRQENSP